AGNIYVADRGNKAIKKIPAGGGSVITLATGLTDPNGVAVDATGYVFVADGASHQVKVIAPGGGVPSPILLNISFSNPTDAVLDGIGNIYVTDTNLGNGSGNLREINLGYFITPALPAGLSIDENSGIIIGTPTVTSPAANYTVTAYNSGGSNSTIANITVDPYRFPTISYQSPQVYFVNVPINPLTPTSRDVFAPGNNRNVIDFASGLSGPAGVAVDAAGNVYVAETGKNDVIKIAANGSGVTVLAAGFNTLRGVAVDTAGNVYVADKGNHWVQKITTGGTVVTLASGFSNPNGIAVDDAGNVYVADGANV